MWLCLHLFHWALTTSCARFAVLCFQVCRLHWTLTSCTSPVTFPDTCCGGYVYMCLSLSVTFGSFSRRSVVLEPPLTQWNWGLEIRESYLPWAQGPSSFLSNFWSARHVALCWLMASTMTRVGVHPANERDLPHLIAAEVTHCHCLFWRFCLLNSVSML